jgi:hypothetical protein
MIGKWLRKLKSNCSPGRIIQTFDDPVTPGTCHASIHPFAVQVWAGGAPCQVPVPGSRVRAVSATGFAISVSRSI